MIRPSKAETKPAVPTFPTDDPYVVLYSIDADQYKSIHEALGEYLTRHAYSNDTLRISGLLHGVPWANYKKFLEALGDHRLRHAYSKGTLELMSPRRDHDWVKNLIGRMIETMSLKFDIPIMSVGSTTLTKDDVEKGIEPDESYYVQNELSQRGQKTYDPDIDPPPDLTVEVDVTSSCVSRTSTFAELGIPELWRYEGNAIRFYRLVKSGKRKGTYQEIPKSIAFPFVHPEDVAAALGQMELQEENAVVRLFLKLVKARRKSEAQK